MIPAYVDMPLAYRLAIGASVTLGGSWLCYLTYLGETSITKQSVYIGAITFYAALLSAVTCIAFGVLICAVGYLVRTRHQLSKSAALWGACSILVVLAVFAITRPMIGSAT
ncbi:MAG: hypothetical protein A3G29_05920 [Burkholderiales bacterium RIFCSPLOWO2_12_FULL_64_99]|nr:MAG: hypothetical protein A3E52_02975 [Burkholderiales bacterium RIFCSPHIGHO2_12_FULL_63_20]OGB61036.1 MAG: hypothetical protein A3G29_05920 [Burkholderiales bacterium RIFCSPLOWO2_12_FULL_64_99]